MALVLAHAVLLSPKELKAENSTVTIPVPQTNISTGMAPVLQELASVLLYQELKLQPPNNSVIILVRALNSSFGMVHAPVVVPLHWLLALKEAKISAIISALCLNFYIKIRLVAILAKLFGSLESKLTDNTVISLA